MKKNHKVKGFTLIELIIVIAIFGVIMAGALNLLQPSRTLFNRSYSEESTVSGATQINKYLEESLRYASVIRVTEDAPTDAQLKDVIDECYMDKLNVQNLTADPDPANGLIYVLEVNNKPDANGNTGVIRKWSYEYTAGGHVKDDGGVEDAVVDGPKEFKGDYAVNAAIYNDFNYTISLGIFERKRDDAKNVFYLDKNATYYDYNSTNSFGLGNFGFTVTAYPKKLTSAEKAAFESASITEPRFDYAAGVYGYTYCAVYANGIQLENYWDHYNTGTRKNSTYLRYKLGADNKKEVVDGKNVYATKDVDNSILYQCYATEPQMNPDHFYIIYIYNENEIVAG